MELHEIKEKANCPVVFLKNQEAANHIQQSAMTYHVVPTTKKWYIQHDNMGKFSILKQQPGFGVICPGYMTGWSMKKIQQQIYTDFQLKVSAGADHWIYSDV
jgi:hypothetical protein